MFERAERSDLESEPQRINPKSTTNLDTNYIKKVISNFDIDKNTILKCDIKSNTEFIKNSSDEEQLFSFACFFYNVLCQALGGEGKYDSIEEKQTISNYIPNHIQKYFYDKKFTNFFEGIKLRVKSYGFIIIPENQIEYVAKYSANVNLNNKIEILSYNDQRETKSEIIQKVSKKVQLITRSFLSFTLDQEYLNENARIYISILYFKGTWFYKFEKCQNQREFTKLDGEKIMRNYIESLDRSIRYSKYELGSSKELEVFILPFFNIESGRFNVIYLSPKFFLNGKNDLTAMYAAFIEKFTIQVSDDYCIDENKFNHIDANIFIPKFDQICDELDLIKLLPETYQGWSSSEIKSFMKLRVKIDEKGIEGAAVACTPCFACMPPEKQIIDIIVERPYIALVYDETLQITLFTIKDNGYE